MQMTQAAVPSRMPSAAGSRLRDRKIWVSVASLIAVALTAVVAKDYLLFQATLVLSFAMALVGLNILVGFNGQISLGHGAFYALGAYVTAMLIHHVEMPYWMAVPAAGAISMLFGYLFGLPAVRLQGLYLALATFALSVALPTLLKFKGVENWTGGVQGLAILKPEAPFGIPVSADQWLFLVSAVLTIALFLLAHNLIGSRFGKALVAIRDQPLAAEAMGINGRQYKAVAFAVSAFYTGLGGAISALAIQFVAPDTFGMFLSISLLVGIVVGGMHSVVGSLYGAIFIVFIPSLAEKVSKDGPWAVYGVVLILVVFLMPSGIAGVLGKLSRKLRR